MDNFEDLHINDVIEEARTNKNDFAYRYIIKKYDGMLHGVIRRNGFYMPGADNEDLVQEARNGLYRAINIFNSEKSSFENFAQFVIKRHLITAIKKAKRLKHTPLNDAYSLDKTLPDNENLTMMDKIGYRDELNNVTDIDSMDPEERFILEETAKINQELLDKMLSEFERNVHRIHLQNKTYKEIMEELNISDAKKVDNTLQRVKRKFKDVQILLEKEDELLTEFQKVN